MGMKTTTMMMMMKCPRRHIAHLWHPEPVSIKAFQLGEIASPAHYSQRGATTTTTSPLGRDQLDFNWELASVWNKTTQGENLITTH